MIEKLFLIGKKLLSRCTKRISQFFSVFRVQLFQKPTKKTFRFRKKIVLLLLFVVIAGIIAPIGVQPAHAFAFGGLGVLAVMGVTYGVSQLFGGKIVDATAGALFELLTDLIKDIGAWFVSVAEILLDKSIQYTLNTENLALDGIKTGWSIIRDVANMLFIFALLYIAFAMILQLGGNFKQLLVILIIVALLINFSFFLTGLVIDASNILGLFIYNAIAPLNTATPNDPTDRITIGSQLSNALDTDSAINKKVIKSLDSNVQKGVVHLMAGVVFFTTGVVFLFLALLFVFRTVVLMFILILSPLAFAAAVLPATRKHFHTWLNKLINQAFVAPVTLLLLAIVVGIVNAKEIRTAAGTEDASFISAFLILNQDGTTFDVDTFGIFLSFAIILGLLVGVLIVARSMAGSIANLSTKYTGKLIGLGVGAAAGAAAVAGRRGLGPLARAARDSEWAEKGGKSKNVFTRYASRAAIRTADYGARSSFDVRATGAAKMAAGGLGALGVKADFGKAEGKGGYESDIKRRDLRRAAVADNLDEAGKRKYAEDIYARSPTGLKRRAMGVGGKPAKTAQYDLFPGQAAGAAAKAAKETADEKSVGNIMDNFKKTQRRKERRDDLLHAVREASETLDQEKPSSKPKDNVAPTEKPKESKES